MKTTTSESFSIGDVIGIAILLAGLWGYVANIIGIIHMLTDPITGLFILRIAGIFFVPLGVILGYF